MLKNYHRVSQPVEKELGIQVVVLVVFYQSRHLICRNLAGSLPQSRDHAKIDATSVATWALVVSICAPLNTIYLVNQLRESKEALEGIVTSNLAK